MPMQFSQIERQRDPAWTALDPLPTPVRLGEWELERVVQVGGLSVVYRASRADRRVAGGYAVKVLRAKLHDDARCVRRFLQEAEALSAVRHVSLPELTAVEPRRRPLHLVMPWLCGTPLDQYLRFRKGGAVSWRESLRWAAEWADALAGLADAGWTHGDFKPANVLHRDDAPQAVLDLGFARRLDAIDAEPCLLGTIAYMAPEQFSSKARPSTAADLFSLGATWYECLAGRPLFPGATLAEVLTLRRERPHPDLAVDLPHVPPAGAELIAELLSTRPEDRPPSPRLVAEAARAWLAALPEESTAPTAGGSSELSLAAERAARAEDASDCVFPMEACEWYASSEANLEMV